ncbi:unnamed protein product [Penicillium crustosum]
MSSLHAPSAFQSHRSGLCSSFNRICLEDHIQSLPPHPPDVFSSFDQLRLEVHNLSTQTQPDVNPTTYQYMYPGDNGPSKWTVLEVVAFLCRNEPVPWAYGLVPPDFVALEASIRNNLIDDNYLFYRICERNIQSLPGLRIIPHRLYVLCGIAWLQLRSPRFTLSPVHPPSPALGYK